MNSELLAMLEYLEQEREIDKATLFSLVEEALTGAAIKELGESVENPLLYYNNNIDGLVAILELQKKVGISNLVFSSSCTVYGQPEKLPVTERYIVGMLKYIWYPIPDLTSSLQFINMQIYS